jgi:hypothetical protein
MRAEKLSDIKKELRSLNPDELIEICLRLAKYKKDSKELLSYLLYNADNPMAYAEEVKFELLPSFRFLNRSVYTSTKELRKILRLLTKHAKYTASKEVEVELLLWFCDNYLKYANIGSTHKPLQTIFFRQLEKLRKALPKLHEDLQFDYGETYKTLLNEASGKIKYFNAKEFEV